MRTLDSVAAILGDAERLPRLVQPAARLSVERRRASRVPRRVLPGDRGRAAGCGWHWHSAVSGPLPRPGAAARSSRWRASASSASCCRWVRARRCTDGSTRYSRRCQGCGRRPGSAGCSCSGSAVLAGIGLASRCGACRLRGRWSRRRGRSLLVNLEALRAPFELHGSSTGSRDLLSARPTSQGRSCWSKCRSIRRRRCSRTPSTSELDRALAAADERLQRLHAGHVSAVR